MGEANASWAIDVNGLSLCIGAAASSGIMQVTNAHATRHTRYLGPILENLSCHAILLAQVDLAAGVTGGHAGSTKAK